MNEPLVQVTNELGVVVGAAPMLEAFEGKLIRHTAYVMLVDDEEKFLLQKRSTAVPNYAGFWDASAGGHIDEGESPETAAYRELQEELGVNGVELQRVKGFYFESEGDGRTYKYYAHAFVGTLPSRWRPGDLSDEVESVELFNRSEVSQLDNIIPIAKYIINLL